MEITRGGIVVYKVINLRTGEIYEISRYMERNETSLKTISIRALNNVKETLLVRIEEINKAISEKEGE